MSSDRFAPMMVGRPTRSRGWLNRSACRQVTPRLLGDRFQRSPVQPGGQVTGLVTSGHEWRIDGRCGGGTVTGTWQADEAIDDAAAKAFFAEFGEPAEHMPPVAVVIAAYNEQGVIGSVVDALPASICGLPPTTLGGSGGAPGGARGPG